MEDINIIRKCSKCGYKEDQNNFEYLRDSVWACPICGSKYTEIDEVKDEGRVSFLIEDGMIE